MVSVNAIRAIWARQEVRFLVVGGWNTLFGYLAFIACNLCFGARLPLTVTLIISYLLSLPQAFVAQKLVVFRDVAFNWNQVHKFATANSVLFAANLLLVPATVAWSGMRPEIAQGLFIVGSTIISYTIHSLITFK